MPFKNLNAYFSYTRAICHSLLSCSIYVYALFSFVSTIFSRRYRIPFPAFYLSLRNNIIFSITLIYLKEISLVLPKNIFFLNIYFAKGWYHPSTSWKSSTRLLQLFLWYTMVPRTNESVGMKASRCNPVANFKKKKTREKREERWMKMEGFWDKEKRKNRVACRRSCILVRLADAARCGSTVLYCYMYYKIYYSFTATLLRREHRRPPVLLLATTGHVHETIDDPP